MREAIAADLASERVDAETKWKMEEEQRQANVRREALEALEERLEAERRAEEEQKQAEAKARQQAEEEARLLEAEAKRRAEEERKQAEAVAARQEAEEKARRLEAEAKRKVKEEQKLDMATVGRANVDRRALALAAAVVLLLIGAGGYTVVQQMNRSSADLLSATTEAEAVEARKMAALFTSKEAMEGVWFLVELVKCCTVCSLGLTARKCARRTWTATFIVGEFHHRSVIYTTQLLN